MLFVKEPWKFMEIDRNISVEVAYASLTEQKILMLQVKEGTTINDAIYLSGILTVFPEIDLSRQKVGVFSKIKKLDEVVHDGERVEIYRPLVLDPKEARRRRDKGA